MECGGSRTSVGAYGAPSDVCGTCGRRRGCRNPHDCLCGCESAACGRKVWGAPVSGLGYRLQVPEGNVCSCKADNAGSRCCGAGVCSYAADLERRLFGAKSADDVLLLCGAHGRCDGRCIPRGTAEARRARACLETDCRQISAVSDDFYRGVREEQTPAFGGRRGCGRKPLCGRRT